MKITTDHLKQVVEVVGDAASELAERFHLLRLGQGGLGLLKLLFGFLPLADISGHLGEADDLAAVIANCVDNDVGPERAAILALAQALGFPASLAGSCSQTPGRYARGGVLGRIEPAEMRPDDLVGCIAFDTLRPGVPARDAAFRVEHVDGVVGHALHQQAELLLAAL